MTDGRGTTSYTDDDANRLFRVTAPVTGAITSTYDALGRRVSMTYPCIRRNHSPAADGSTRLIPRPGSTRFGPR